MKELVVTGPKSPAIATTDDLSGKTVHVRKSSSYYESLEVLNGRFKKEGKSTVKIVLVPDALEDEDKMEMLNAGLLEVIIVDDWLAKMWVQILPKIKVNEQAAVREGGKIGWAIRKDTPKLKAEILEFYQTFLKKQGVLAYRLKQYMSRVKQIKDPTGKDEWKRFNETLVLFEKYGQKYNFDSLLEMKDAGLVAASAAAQVDSADKILTLGDSYVEGVVVIDVSAIEVADGNEQYIIGDRLCARPDVQRVHACRARLERLNFAEWPPAVAIEFAPPGRTTARRAALFAARPSPAAGPTVRP